MNLETIRRERESLAAEFVVHRVFGAPTREQAIEIPVEVDADAYAYLLRTYGGNVAVRV